MLGVGALFIASGRVKVKDTFPCRLSHHPISRLPYAIRGKEYSVMGSAGVYWGLQRGQRPLLLLVRSGWNCTPGLD